MITPDWKVLRAEFPALAKWTYLNTATYGLMPRSATAAMNCHLARRDELACGDYLDWFDDMDAIRESCARLIHCEAADIAFVHNAAAGMALLIQGLSWLPGDEVLTLDDEFPNQLYVSATLARFGAKLRAAPWTEFYESVSERTRLAVLSTVNYATGFRPPLEEISRFLRERGVLLYVDGSQSVGALQFDIQRVRPSVLCVDAYKWMLSANGAGFLYVEPELRQRLPATVVGWRSDRERQDALENRVRTEMEWLRRSPKARATKAKARMDQAQDMIGELADLKNRTSKSSADIDFLATDRRTKRLIHLDGVAHGFNGRLLFEDLSFTITAAMHVGLVGANGSGKTTLLRILRGETEPLQGKVERADGLRVVYFDQMRQLDPNLTLRRALAPAGDSVIYRDRVIHVASWAARFLFLNEQLDQPVARLSGGEKARVLIANLMLEPADVLLLDEPTNDLDIPTLEILEESLLEFPGALVLVTHDRYLLDRVSTVVLGLDQNGRAERFADYSQWEIWRAEQKQSKPKPAAPAAPRSTPAQKRLSYLENREYLAIEGRIAQAEQILREKRDALQDDATVKDGRLLDKIYREMQEAQRAVDELYARWSELEEKAN
ncbi:MAG TPA: aminotransferase class V-fold PLP-dependent enzyme [Bryobacteraceae bacterium]|nr:aminotransferase class V-fold PLP-dependent enzyme [Bryobacteraceae bacterium]